MGAGTIILVLLLLGGAYIYFRSQQGPSSKQIGGAIGLDLLGHTLAKSV